MIATSQKQYIELVYKAVDNIKEFQSLKKEYEKLNNDLIKFKKVIKQNEKLFSSFKIISREIEQKIQNAQFDTKLITNLAKEIDALQYLIKKLENLSKQIQNYSYYKNKMSNASEVISFCYSKMKIAEIKKTSQKLDNFIQNFEILISGVGDKENKLNNLLNEVSENKKLWSEDCTYFESMINSLKQEIKNKDIDIEYIKTEIKQKKKAKKEQIENFKNNLHEEFKDSYSDEIESYKNTHVSKSEFENFANRVYAQIENIIKERAELERQAKLKKNLIIAGIILGNILLVIFIFTPFWWISIILGIGDYGLLYKKAKDEYWTDKLFLWSKIIGGIALGIGVIFAIYSFWKIILWVIGIGVVLIGIIAAISDR